MGELYNSAMSYQRDDRCMSELARACGIRTRREASDAYGVAVPVVIQGLLQTTTSRGGTAGLMTSARALSWVERSEPAELFSSIEHRIGADIVEKLFGQSVPSVRAQLADEAGIAEVSARGLLEITALVTTATLTGVSRDEFTEASFVAAVQAEGHSPAPRARELDYEDQVDAASERSPLLPATSDRDRPDVSAAATSAAAAPAVGRTASFDDGPDSYERGQTAAAADGTLKKRLLLGGVVVAVALLGFGFMASQGSGDETVADDVDADVEVVADDEAAGDESAEDEGSGSEPEEIANAADGDDQLPVNSAGGDIVQLSVPMHDTEDPDNDASGVLAFELNKVTGEVCYSVESDNIEGPYRSHIHVGDFGVKGGIVVDLGPLESGATGCVDNLPVDTNAILANRSGHYAELHDLSEEWTIRGQLSETIDGDVVSISVPMTDIEDPDNEASGVLAFDLNQVTGEVCYSVESENIEGPYRSHIHVGEAGVKGGIVVDLGPLESGATGCVDNLPVDTNAILANRSGHYAELHDLSEEWTIRGQLSETTVTDGTGPATVVDTDGGGARTVLDAGTIYLEGEVPDQATADELVASLAGVDSSTPIVNNLRVVDGAPLPSGRVIIADAIFFDVNSDVVKEIDESTLSAITALAGSRDDWILTVVGHTDNSGPDLYNLELSLRRATALRDLLAEQGIPDETLRIRGAGETAPIGDNGTEAGRAQNRRIEFELAPKG